ncbi:DUF2913 family protein [Vibrio parahaemolyticus]|nr:DUF2913 family protein [Vibrio parahaemolyticus]EIV1599682.1 DUF2913 family protein [Vibrio parahaemolyticus]
MKSNEYHNQLQNLIENTLLNLYIFIKYYKKTNNVRHVKIEIRNKVISDFLKSQQKKTCYKLLKRDIKVLINSKKLGSIEKNLLELYKPDIKKETDLEKFLILVNSFEDTCFSVELIDDKPEQKEDTLFILKDHVEFCFDDSDSQIEPISLLIKTKTIDIFESILKKQEYFKYKLIQSSKENFNFHYFLYNHDVANKM